MFFRTTSTGAALEAKEPLSSITTAAERLRSYAVLTGAMPCGRSARPVSRIGFPTLIGSLVELRSRPRGLEGMTPSRTVRSAPWSRSMDRTAAEDWIRAYVEPAGAIETAHERPWATVLRVPLADSVAWFKA